MSRWGGEGAELLRKTPLVEAGEGRLPVYTLTFATPPGLRGLVRMDHGDVVKVCVPNYKPKSYSMSAEREDQGEFDITLKIYPNGRASGYLDRVKVGESITVFKMGKKLRNEGGFLGLVAYGVGITEALPLAAAELERVPVPADDGKEAKPCDVILLWASRTMADTFWHDKLEALCKEHTTRFKWVNILSREKNGQTLQGRINPSVLQEVFDGSWQTGAGMENEQLRPNVRFLSIGTKPMMNQTDAWWHQIGYPMPKHKLLV